MTLNEAFAARVKELLKENNSIQIRAENRFISEYGKLYSAC